MGEVDCCVDELDWESGRPWNRVEMFGSCVFDDLNRSGHRASGAFSKHVQSSDIG